MQNQPRPLEALEAENAQLRLQVNQLQQVLHQRAEPMAMTVMDAVDVWCAMAEQGHPVARELLTRWNAVQERARTAATGLTVVRSPNGGVPH